MIQSWLIEKAGGICAASEIKNNRGWSNVGLEAIFAWDPEYLFATSSTMLNYSIPGIYAAPAWSGARAVLDGRVYQIPAALDTWDMPGINCALGAMYMLHKMYPDRFSQADLRREIDEYYTFMFGKTFDEAYLGYDLGESPGSPGNAAGGSAGGDAAGSDAVGGDAKGPATQAFSVLVNGVEVTNDMMAAYPIRSAEAVSTNTYGATSAIKYTGYSVADTLKAAGLNDKYIWLRCVATDGYSVTLSGDIVMSENTLLALTRDGEPYPFAPWFAPCDSQASPNYVRAVDYILVNTSEGPPDIDAPGGGRAGVGRAGGQTTPQPGTPGTATGNADTRADDARVLVITGDGAREETSWTLGQLKAMTDGYREYTYSTTNNWPTFSFSTARGVSLPYLLKRAGMLDGARSVKLIAYDGYSATVTVGQVFGEQYAYAAHSFAGSSEPAIVEPVISWYWGDGASPRAENIRPYFGQAGPWEVNTSSFVKNLAKIEVSMESAGVWPAPTASLPDGAAATAGTVLELDHPNLDNVRIYYTIDGSEPGYDSPVYNPSTRYFQPQLIAPIELRKSLTVKAFAAGYGKDPSPVAVFAYTVK